MRQALQQAMRVGRDGFLHRGVLWALLWVVLLTLRSQGQEAGQEANRTGNGTTDRGRAPGLNAAVTVAAAHDSAIGWYTVVVPVASYAFSSRWSADASLPVYPYRLSSSVDPQTLAAGALRYNGVDLGDALVRAHGSFGLGRTGRGQVQNLTTVSMTLPTGNREDGLGTGTPTFNVDSMMTRYAGRAGMFVDAGAGNSPGLVNRQVTEDDSSPGPQAQFAAGVAMPLPAGALMESYAYEQLPLGDQKTYTSFTRLGRSVATGRKVYEDNGFNTALYLPVSEHVTLTGTYNRSLRLHLDTVSAGVTYVWRGNPSRRRLTLIEKAMREAESGKGDLPYPGK